MCFFLNIYISLDVPIAWHHFSGLLGLSASVSKWVLIVHKTEAEYRCLPLYVLNIYIIVPIEHLVFHCSY